VKIMRLVLVAAAFIGVGSGTAALALDVGTQAPAFDLPVFGQNEKHVALAQARGKVVLVDFWASWCGPCRQSFPLYEKLRTELPARDFTLLAINLDEMNDGPTAFLYDHPVHYTLLADPAGDIAKKYGLRGMPSSFIIDRDGVVRARHTGFKPQDIDDVRKEIRALIATPDAEKTQTGKQADAK